jgi:hypothetical protein
MMNYRKHGGFMATQINFGKYRGWTMEELAQAGPEGRSYLQWCAGNLRNPQLRKAAESALATCSVNSLSPALMRRLEVQLGELTPEEIEREIEDRQHEAEEEAKRDAIIGSAETQLKSDLRTLGANEQVIGFVWRNRHDADIVFETVKFSSPEKERLFKAAWDKWEAALEAAFIG